MLLMIAPFGQDDARYHFIPFLQPKRAPIAPLCIFRAKNGGGNHRSWMIFYSSRRKHRKFNINCFSAI
jgi:hypothetical protein